MDSGYVQEGMEEYTYEISGEISANRVNISGNTWKINKISASYLELQEVPTLIRLKQAVVSTLHWNATMWQQAMDL